MQQATGKLGIFRSLSG